jgi:hypothetical protein
VRRVAAERALDCRNASKLLSLSCERALEAAELEALKRHLDACLMCRNFEAQLKFLREAAGRYGSG